MPKVCTKMSSVVERVVEDPFMRLVPHMLIAMRPMRLIAMRLGPDTRH